MGAEPEGGQCLSHQEKEQEVVTGSSEERGDSRALPVPKTGRAHTFLQNKS